MFTRCFGIVVAFTVASVFSCKRSTTCQVRNQPDHVEGRCPVRLTSVRAQTPDGMYSEDVTVHVRMKNSDVSKTPCICIECSNVAKKITCILKKKKRQCRGTKGCCRGDTHRNTSAALWEMVHCCGNAKADSEVSVCYNTSSTSCCDKYIVPDPRPEFDLSVNPSSKSVNITVKTRDKVYVRWCHKGSGSFCMDGGPRQIIDPSRSRSALIENLPFLPCVCVEVYYTHTDARRHKKCPFQNESITDVTDVWQSSEVTLYAASLLWSSKCPVSVLNVSASLCWRQHEHFCTTVPNSTLRGEDNGQSWNYSLSAMDKHPQMCIQFSVQGSRNISCPFKDDTPSWQVNIGPGRQSLSVYLTSSVKAKFSAQLCVLNESRCTPTGQVHSVRTDGKSTETKINVPCLSFAERPCVQVWQSDPFLRGRRFLCPDYTQNRYGLYAVAVLMFVVTAALLGVFIHRLVRRDVAGWLCIQKPVLLVCSSEQSAHISAVCALSSILQGELGATVHTALWAHSSQTQAGTRTGVADLGPLPWLYGQWEAVRKERGKVLIVWSPEAKTMYEKWRKERANVDKNEKEKEAEVGHEKTREEVEKNWKLNGKLAKCQKEKAAGKKRGVKSCVDEDAQREPSAVIAPVFTAALTCLEGVLRGCKGQGVAVVYFQGLCHRKDIPKPLRAVSRYCLPQDFRGLIQELDGMRRQTKTGKFRWPCWPRLLSKVLSIWLARKLAQRLQTLLPQMQDKKARRPRATSSDKTQSGFKVPPAVNMAEPGTEQEREPLHGSPWGEEKR